MNSKVKLPDERVNQTLLTGMSQRPLSKDRVAQLRRLDQQLGYTFRSLPLLDLALTHKSYADQAVVEREEKSPGSYEGLEFLGDAILGFVISEFLFLADPTRPEGEFSKIKGFLVSAAQLYRLSLRLELGHYLRVSKGEEKTGGRRKRAILADLFESLVAAIYLDRDLSAARNFILCQYAELFEKIGRNELDFIDYKSRLQERLHAKGLSGPHYRLVREFGPDHQKQFVIEVSIGERAVATGTGRSKKEAEQKAAARAFGSVA